MDITASNVEAHQDHRLKEGKARATVNREVRYLLHGFKLLFDAHEISVFPKVKLLAGENVREGFINRPEFDAICAELAPDVQDLVKFLYLSAWRSGEAKKLERSKVDLTDWVVRLTRKNEKTKRPRTLALVGELRELIERRLAELQAECPLVFHRKGRPIKTFRTAFRSASCKTAGLAGIVPHDMRRSAVRNFTKAGLSESEGMSISGHAPTLSISATTSLTRICNGSRWNE